MAPGFFRKLFTKIKDGAKKVFDFGKKAVKTLVDVVPKVAPAVAPVIDKLIPGSGAAIQGLSSGLQAIQPIFKNNVGRGKGVGMQIVGTRDSIPAFMNK